MPQNIKTFQYSCIAAAIWNLPYEQLYYEFWNLPCKIINYFNSSKYYKSISRHKSIKTFAIFMCCGRYFKFTMNNFINDRNWFTCKYQVIKTDTSTFELPFAIMFFTESYSSVEISLAVAIITCIILNFKIKMRRFINVLITSWDWIGFI